MATHVVTSTPKQQENETNALREKRWNSIIEKTEEFHKKEKTKMRPQSKENYRRRNNFRNYKNQKNFEAYSALAEKRRKQAIESMQIAEQRRIRKIAENENAEKLAEDFGNLNLSNTSGVEYLPDGRLKLTKKQLADRRIKQNRIRKHFEEQQKRKKKSVSFRKPVFSNEPSPPYHPPRKVFHIPKSVNVPEPEKIEEPVMKNEAKPIIRYTKEELRELCPYGYYFLK